MNIELMDTRVRNRRIQVGEVDTFYREAGPADAPVVLLPHGYPCSSYEFRELMPRLADRWRLVAPDYPGCGYSATPEDFDYSFDGYAAFLNRFVKTLGIRRFALYLHDFGSPIGARLAIGAPERVTALIIQNGDIPYEDALGPKYAEIERTWTLPAEQMRAQLAEAITEDIFKEEFLNAVRPELAECIPPDLWKLHWSLVAGHATAQGDRSRPDRRAEREPRLVSRAPEVPRRAPSPDVDRMGPAGSLHARGIRARVPSGPARCRTPLSRRRALAAGDAPRRSRGVDAGLSRAEAWGLFVMLVHGDRALA